MEFISKSTAERLVSNQLKQLRQKADNYSNEAIRKQLHPQKVLTKTKFSRKYYENQAEILFGDLLILSHWQARTLKCFTFIPITKIGDETIPTQVVFCVQHFNTRTRLSSHQEGLIITNHALQRLSQRKSNLNVINALKEEITADQLLEITEVFANAIQNHSEDFEFKISTVNGIGCFVYDKQKQMVYMKTWF